MITEEEKLLVYLKHQDYMDWYDVNYYAEEYKIDAKPGMSLDDYIEQQHQDFLDFEFDWSEEDEAWEKINDAEIENLTK
jgi:hypothetical protein